MKLKLGVAVTRRDCFQNEKTLENRDRILQKVAELSKELDFDYVTTDFLGGERMMIELSDAAKVEEYFKAEKVDALFIPHANFGQEESVARLAKNMGLPLLIWGPRDECPKGQELRPTDTQCGLFACSKVLRRYGVTFSYIENCDVEDPAFRKGLEKFLAVARVVNKFHHLRIGQVSVRPRQFMSVMCNEAELLERFGIEVVPIPAYDIVASTRKIREEWDSETQEILDAIHAKGIDTREFGEERLKLMCSLETALLRFAREFSLDALSVECWDVFLNDLGFKPCFVFGDLTDRMLPCACENDIHGAIMLALAVAANNQKEPPFFADLTIRHPHNDNAELLWHCGPFAKSLMKEGASPSLAQEGQGFYPIHGGQVTLLRFDALKGNYTLFADSAQGTDGPETCGNYLWVEVDDWVKWEKKFIFGPYIHHVTGLFGDYVDVFQEVCRYMDIPYDNADKPLF